MWAVDTHCHLDRYGNPPAIARSAKAAGVFIVAVTNLPSHFFLGVPHVKALPGVRLAIGFHPMVAAENVGEIPDFKRGLSMTSFVGEIGLDLSIEGKSSEAAQVNVLSQLLPELVDRPRFITFHSRGAERKLLLMLREVGLTGSVLHWYSGPTELIDSFIDDGHYFSVNPAMLSSRNGQRILRAVPRDRLLTETDGPHTRCGNQDSKPVDVRFVVDGISKLWNVSVEEAAATTLANFRRIVARIGSEPSS